MNTENETNHQTMSKKNITIAVVAAVAVIVACAILFAVIDTNTAGKGNMENRKPATSTVSGSSKNTDTDKSKTSDQTKSPDAAVKDAPKTQNGGAEKTEQKDNEPTKYGNAEVYTDANGEKAAKTEDGEEVEITTENLNSLMAEYEKVKGTDSEAEKKLLDKIQVILEVSQNQAPQK